MGTFRLKSTRAVAGGVKVMLNGGKAFVAWSGQLELMNEKGMASLFFGV